MCIHTFKRKIFENAEYFATETSVFFFQITQKRPHFKSLLKKTEKVYKSGFSNSSKTSFDNYGTNRSWIFKKKNFLCFILNYTLTFRNNTKISELRTFPLNSKNCLLLRCENSWHPMECMFGWILYCKSVFRNLKLHKTRTFIQNGIIIWSGWLSSSLYCPS